ncbi:MAG: lytic transglycosylase domain-containing protein [Acidobacteria bacterium]|nr:lytic transglycosylase domain-containing protein [Acidobacteriota bacterium]
MILLSALPPGGPSSPVKAGPAAEPTAGFFPTVSFDLLLQRDPGLRAFASAREEIDRLPAAAERTERWRGVIERKAGPGDETCRGLARLKLGDALAGEDPPRALESYCHPEVFRHTALAGPAFERLMSLLESRPELADPALRLLDAAKAGAPADPELRYRWVRHWARAGRAGPVSRIPGGSVAARGANVAWQRLESVLSAREAGNGKAARDGIRDALMDISSPAAWDEARNLAEAASARDWAGTFLSAAETAELGRKFLESQQYRRSWRCFSAVSATPAFRKLPVSMHLSAALSAYRAGEPALALRWAEKIKPSTPVETADRWCLIALCTNRLKKVDLFGKAVPHVLALGQESDLYLPVLRTLAFGAEMDGDLEAVRKLYGIVAARGDSRETRAEAWWKIAWADYAEGRFDLADAGFVRAHGEDPGKEFALAALYWHGVCSLRRANAPEASAVFAAIPRVFPCSYYAELAREHSSRLGRIDPLNVRTAYWMASLQVRYFPPVELPLGTWVTGPGKGELAFLLQSWAAGYPDATRRRLLALGGENPPRDVHALLFDLSWKAGDTFLLIRHFNRAWPEAYGMPLESLPRPVWEALYPARYRDLVERELAGSPVDPWLVLSLIRQESAFREDVRSVSNAVGLMQLLPSTAAVEARWKGRTAPLEKRLEEPGFNIRLGCGYLLKVLRMMDGRVPLALGGYNGGPGRVVKVFTRWQGRLSMEEIVEMIPMTETRNYVKSIFRNYNYYCRLYRGSPAAIRPFLDGRAGS